MPNRAKPDQPGKSVPPAKPGRAPSAREIAARVDHGNALFSLGDWAEAEQRYREALAMAPDSAEIHVSLANALARRGDSAAAIATLRSALVLDANHAGAHSQLGTLLRASGERDAALESFRRAVYLRPHDPAARFNIGTVLADLDRLEEAVVWFGQAAQVQAPHVPAFAALGTALLLLGRPQEALPWFRTARQAGDSTAPTRLAEGLCLLTLGALREGWEGWEARPVPAAFDSTGHAPRWDGSQPLRGRTLLVWAEQGMGDCIQFVRYLPQLRTRGARVVLSAPPALHRLFAGLADALVAPGDSLTFDLHCPLPSLPRAFGTELETIPARVPYLAPTPALREQWAPQIGKRPRIGLVWAGNPDHARDRHRSLPFATVSPLLALPGIGWHVLQHELPGEVRDALAGLPQVRVLGPEFADFADTAAVVAGLDLVISADTSVAHLAGALGRPCWIMLADAADFRWLHGRADSPWYPSVRLFRQARRGDWDGVVAEVAEALTGFTP